MPPSPSGKQATGMSFMPKGSSLSKNIRRAKDEDIQFDSQSFRGRNSVLQQDDFNESSNSDEGSKYSYEDSGDDTDQGFIDKNLYGSVGFMSPAHSAYESPDALEINSLIQLNSKLPSGRDISARNSPLHNLNDKGEPPSLNLRKIGQPTSLKPLQPTTKKKASPKKRLKNLKTSSVSTRHIDDDENYKGIEIEEEQRYMTERIQNEWAAMQEEFERVEKEKFEKMVKESSKKLEDEELSIRKAHSDQLLELRSELEKKVEEEQNAGKKNLIEIQKANELTYSQEQQAFQQKLDSLAEEKELEISKIKEKNDKEIDEKKTELADELRKETESLKLSQENKIKELKESHSAELILMEKAHTEKINEINLIYSKEANDVKSEFKNANTPDCENLQLESNKMQELLDEKKAEYIKLTEELNNIEEKIKTENGTLLQLEEKITGSQTCFEEIQDEVDKMENDLDLLRTEKSALISEIAILKENVNSEKLNLQNVVKKQEAGTLNSKKINISYDNKSVGTEDLITKLCKDVQASVEAKHVFSQIGEIVTQKHMSSQTSFRKCEKLDKSCQIELNEDILLNMNSISSAKLHSPDINEVNNINLLINKSLENALSHMTNTIEERFKAIEKNIGSMQTNSSHSDSQVPSSSAVNALKTNISAEIEVEPGIFNSNVPYTRTTNDIFTVNSYQNTVTPSQKTCSCVQGDADTCDVMQDVKNSIYRLNDILGQSFMPTLNNSDIVPRLNHSVTTYSSPLNTFYAQFRKLQEKHRAINLKHKCQNEVKRKLPNSIIVSSGSNHLKDLLKYKDNVKTNNIEKSNMYAFDYPDDPLARTRNLILQEKARSWKQAQLQNSSISQNFIPSEHNGTVSDNLSYSVSSRASPGLSEIYTPSQHPFLNFESDPETDYNSWMMRLNALQQRIRNHKLL